MDSEKLTDKQIESWRKVLSTTLGPYALIMPKEEVQKMRDEMQTYIDSESNNFVSKTLSGVVDKEEPIPAPSQNETTFGDLIKEAKKDNTK